MRYQSQRKRVPKLGVKIDTVREYRRTERVQGNKLKYGVFAESRGHTFKRNGRSYSYYL